MKENPNIKKDGMKVNLNLKGDLNIKRERMKEKQDIKIEGMNVKLGRCLIEWVNKWSKPNLKDII